MVGHRSLWLGLALAYGLFLIWHEPWFDRPLTREEVEASFAGRLSKSDIPDEEKANLLAFFSNDDGRPFYNVNLMQYHKLAQYPDGVAREGVVTGADANRKYGETVVPLLLRRGSYPVLASTKIANLLMTANPGGDFYADVAIVRYRSRRAMLDMILSPEYALSLPHKFASLEKNVATPVSAMLVLDGNILVPLLLLLTGMAGSLGVALRARPAP